MDKIAEYRKALIAVLGAVLIILQQLDVVLPHSTWVTSAIAAVTSFLVWLTPNGTKA